MADFYFRFINAINKKAEKNRNRNKPCVLPFTHGCPNTKWHCLSNDETICLRYCKISSGKRDILPDILFLFSILFFLSLYFILSSWVRNFSALILLEIFCSTKIRKMYSITSRSSIFPFSLDKVT